MDLRDYLYSNKIRQIDAAGELRVTPGAFGNIVRGMKCSKELAKKISKWTKGQVAEESLTSKPRVFVKCEHCGSLRRVRNE